MDSIQKAAKDGSVTKIAAMYVACLLIGGLAIFNVLVNGHSAFAIIGSIIAGLVAIAGAMYAGRAVVRWLQA